MIKRSFFLAITMLIFSTIHAQNEPTSGSWFVQPGAFFFDLSSASTTTNIAGAELPGENVSFTNSLVPGVGVGYFFSENISVYSVIAFPPTTDADGINNLDGQKAAEVTYAPFALTGNYHFQFGDFQPFVGAGIAYAAILQVEDKDVTDVEADNSFGFVIRLGFDYMLNEKWGISAATNKLFVGTDITGDAGGAPAVVEASLDPWVYSLGANIRF